MPASGVSRANENKRVRQEALREQLANKGLVQHVLEISEKIADLDTELESANVHRLKTAAELQLKLINKYLPDLKATEHSGQIDSEVIRKHRVSFTRG